LHLLKVDIAIKNSDWKKAKQAIGKAQVVFYDLKLENLESKTLIHASLIDFVNGDYRQSRQKLNTAANKARMAKEPLQEVMAHLTQSFFASKIKLTELMHSHFDLAKQLIELHQLNDEHQISVLSNLAWTTDSISERVVHNQKILSAPFSQLYKYNFYNAAEFIRKELIKQKKFQQVLDSIKPWQRFSFANLTRAQVRFAKKQWLPAAKLAIESYTAARIAQENDDSLDAAILLIQHKAQLSESFNADEYINYISENVTKRWGRINKELLDQLGYW